MALRAAASGLRLARRGLPVAPAPRQFSAARGPVAARAGAKAGDWVQVHYIGTLDDGTIFDSSRVDGREPLEFIIGAGTVIKGFDEAVTGLSPLGTRKQRIEPKSAYGEVNPELRIEVPAEQVPPGLKAGMRVQLSSGAAATVTEVRPDGGITLDLNHELAGKALTFDVELMALAPAERLKRVSFGAGCFWSVQLAFDRVKGVLATEVGYCNGSVPDVTYEQVCEGNTGHAEVVDVTYDEGQVSFDQLCDVFFGKHDPTTLNRQGGDVGTQYRSGIYCYTPEQKVAAKAAIERWQKRFPAPIVTEVDDIKLYTGAEDYHQKYLERGGRFGQPQSAKKGCSDPIRCYG